jgi:hypothetical protein
MVVGVEEERIHGIECGRSDRIEARVVGGSDWKG